MEEYKRNVIVRRITAYNILIITGQKQKFKKNDNFLTVCKCNFEIPIEMSFIVTRPRRSVRGDSD